MAEAVVSAALELLATLAMKELRLLASVKEDIKKLERNLMSIHAVLEDAEEKQMKEESVRLWLRNVKEAAYDLEDILDEWNTVELLESKAHGVNFFLTLKKKVLSLILCDFFPQVSRRHNIAVQIKNINDELDEIAKLKDRYQLVKREIKQPRRVESTAFVDVSKLHGRDEVKKKIVSALLGKNSMQTISIVGMGGIGKTALAQLVYDDNEVRTCFSKRIWVCVSDFFDQIKIARAILESLDPNPTNLSNPSSLQNILDKICEKITNTKFFLVLDDVWTDKDVDWEPFRAIFRRGMSGSKILVTTRKESVAKGMESFVVFNLEKLSDEVCWLILSQIAFVGKDKVLCEALEDVGKEIAKKCKGLPLAAKTLGGLLSGKRSKDEWKNLLDSELWKVNFAEYHDDVFTPLFLSYYDLPSRVRPCFLYCVIFPKDYEMEKYELVTHWMAQGYLNSDDYNIEMESLGEEYFNYLASRSLFQDFIRDEDGSINRCKMHDIVHDFVKFLVKDEISEKKIGVGGLLELTSMKARHLRVISVSQGLPRQPGISFIKGTVKLRSFVTEEFLSTNAASNLFEGGKCLRLLEVSIMGLVPKKIGNLINLRYLKIKSYDKLPEALCKLHNLQFLSVLDTGRLPNGIGKLTNLRHLSSSQDWINFCPKGIARLTSLRTLCPIKSKLSKDSKIFSIGDLKNLDHLRGSVSLDLFEETVDPKELKRANLHKKIHLKELILRWWVRVPPAEDVLLQALNPPSNLRVRILMRP